MIVAFSALLIGGVIAWGVVQFNRIDREELDLEAVASMDPQNYLVVGSDTRDLGEEEGVDAGGIYGNASERPPGGKRADTIVIARLDPGPGTIELLSVPRDLLVDAKKGGGHRINSSYNDGAQNLVDTIERNLGIPINHYVEVNFNGFKGLVEALGGVPLYFDRPVRDEMTGLDIDKAGCYELDGVQALAFARSRHLEYSNGVKWLTDPSGDLGRITRQQVFLRRALGEVTKLGLDDVNSLRVLTGVAVNNVTIDDDLGTSDMIAMARRFAAFDAKAMVVHRLTTVPSRTKAGAAVLEMSRAESQPVLDIFSGKAEASKVTTVPSTTLGPTKVTVDVQNGAGVPGLARKIADRLASVGFVIGEVGNTAEGEHLKTTTIVHGAGAEAQAVLLASKLSPTPQVKADDDLAAGEVVLKLAAEPNVPGSSATAPTTAGASATTAAPPTTVATSGVGTNTPEKTVGLNIGDPPPGVTCG